MAATIQSKLKIEVQKTSTITLTEHDAATMIRKAVGAPDGAQVKFYCGYDILQEVTITWTERSDG